MPDDPTQLNDDDLTNIVRQHGVKTSATARVEKGVLEQIREYEQEKALDEKFDRGREKESDDLDSPEM